MAFGVCFSLPRQAYGDSLVVKRELCQSWECVLRLPKEPWACRSFCFVSCPVTILLHLLVCLPTCTYLLL